MGSALVPVPISTDIEVASVAPGGISTCVTLTNGAIKCWGGNSSGQLGQGSTTSIGASVGDLANLNQIQLDADRARDVQTGIWGSKTIHGTES